MRAFLFDSCTFKSKTLDNLIQYTDLIFVANLNVHIVLCWAWLKASTVLN